MPVTLRETRTTHGGTPVIADLIAPARRATPVPQPVLNRIALDKAAAKAKSQADAMRDIARIIRQAPGHNR